MTLGLILGIIIGAIGLMLCQYREAVQKARKRFRSYEVRIKSKETSLGTVSYLDEGEGTVILCCHAMGGGYDQDLESLGKFNKVCRVITPSRFGYPGSTMPSYPSIDCQVEAYVELLNSLQISRVFILGTSSGSTFAIRFALQHPEMTKGLILLGSNYPQIDKKLKPIPYMGPPAKWLHNFTMWVSSPMMEPMLGINMNVIYSIMPVEKRRDGMILDAGHSNVDMRNYPERYDLSKLSMPVLILHAKDDRLAEESLVREWGSKIPNSSLFMLESGGHLLQGNKDKVGREIEYFVDRHR